jgi:hypothetical protein
MKNINRKDCSVLPLVLKGKWFYMIKDGVKKEEYRLDTPYWRRRLEKWSFAMHGDYRERIVEFRLGYAKNAPRMAFKALLNYQDGEFRYYDRRNFQDHPEWGEPEELHFAIHLTTKIKLIGEKTKGNAGMKNKQPAKNFCSDCGRAIGENKIKPFTVAAGDGAQWPTKFVSVNLCDACAEKRLLELISPGIEHIFSQKPYTVTVDPALTNEELKKDLRTALKIINADIGMKNSIIAQCDPNEPGMADMRRSIADAERLLTKYEGLMKKDK